MHRPNKTSQHNLAIEKVSKVLIIDWLDKYGGAERVIAHFQKIFVFPKVITLANIMQKHELAEIFPSIDNTKITETIVGKLGKRFRVFFFLFHFFANKIVVDKKYNFIFSSSHAIAKGVRKSSPKQLHISYFQARNFNYIWDEAPLYLGIFRWIGFPLWYLLRKIDVAHAQRPDFIISNSNFVKNWVKEKYKRDSVVIYPPVKLDSFSLCTEKEDFYVMVGRMVPIKRFDIAIEAFRKNKKKIILIGDGECRKSLEKSAPDNVIFKGFLEREEVNRYIQRAKGFIQIGVEGFGIASIEAQACGTPILAFADGGVLETVIEHKTGVFFQEQNAESLNQCIEQFEKMQFKYEDIRQNALQFSEEVFEQKLVQFVNEKWYEHTKTWNKT